MNSKHILLTTSGDDRTVLEQIATALVESRLAACCQIGGKVTSVYRWEDKIESSDEWTMSIKTTEGAVEKVCTMICDMHNYELPEVFGVPVAFGSRAYLDWVTNETRND